jgi:Ser/Thr protein kinase RdoA (MazF antagonist)
MGEMTWLAALSEKTGLPVPAPVPNLDGELMTQVETPGIPDGRIVSLMRWVDGRIRSTDLRVRHYKAWGEAVGRMHAFASVWQPPDGFSRYIWDWEGLLGGRYFSEKAENLVTTMPRSMQEPFLEISKETQNVMESLGKSSDAYGMVHGDMYPDNLIFKGDRVFIIDFEDCGFGYWLWDIALALGSNPWTKSWYQNRDAFLDEYLKTHFIPDTQLKHLDTFIAADAATGVIWATQFLLDEPGRRVEHEAWRDGCNANMSRYFADR